MKIFICDECSQYDRCDNPEQHDAMCRCIGDELWQTLTGQTIKCTKHAAKASRFIEWMRVVPLPVSEWELNGIGVN